MRSLQSPRAGAWFPVRLAVTLLTLVGLAWAGDEPTPTTAPGITLVDAQAVDRMKHDAHLVDTRALQDFLAGHLPDALHVDYRERSTRVAAFNPSEDDTVAFLTRLRKFAKPDQAVVFYCNGPSCWKSYKSAIVAKAAGFRRVFWFRGGVTEWQSHGHPVVKE